MGLVQRVNETRREIIRTLLERYNELTDPMQSRNGTGDGEHIPLMPATYTHSIRELERLLAIMRTERRSQWWHVTERYINATQVLRDIPVRRKTKHGKTITVLERRVVHVYSPAVRNEKVRRGITWLADNWTAPLEPMLPKEILIAA